MKQRLFFVGKIFGIIAVGATSVAACAVLIRSVADAQQVRRRLAGISEQELADRLERAHREFEIR